MTKISCIIPAYNAEKFLRRAVKSLVDTKYPALEIVIVDDGSIDATWSIAQSLVKETSGMVRALRHRDQKNHGVSAARNLGINQSAGDWICFLDADDYVLPHRFDVAVKLLARDAEIDGVHELVRMEFESEPEGEHFWRDDGMFGLGPVEGSLIKALLRGGCWATSGVLVRRSLFEKAGMFPENFSFAEDFHLWLRMSCVGKLVFGNRERPVAVYCRHNDNCFRPGLERKLDIVAAMVDAHSWLRRHKYAMGKPDDMIAPIVDYIQFALIRAREDGQLGFGRRLVRFMFGKRFYPAIFSPLVLRQIPHFYVSV